MGRSGETPPGFALETDLPILRGMPAPPSPCYQEAKSGKNPEALQRNVKNIKHKNRQVYDHRKAILLQFRQVLDA